MNERIEKLIRKSNILFPGTDVVDCKIANIEKFAELIVRECISVVDSLASPDDSDDYFWTVQNTSSKLKEHFGVEE